MTALVAGRYQIVDELGKGGMGIVYRALDRLTGGHVALKQVTISETQLEFATRYSHSNTADFRFALAQEFKTLSTMRHPHIISVLDYGFDKSRQPFFTMEVLTGAQTIIEARSTRTVNEQVELLVQLLQALAYLHRRGIIHRDLKPDNVIVRDGVVKVLDFGLAVARDFRNESDGLVGTFAYMAPEILQGNPATEASDLYAVGMIAYEMLTGEYPFDSHDVGLLVNSILTEEIDVDDIQVDDQLKAMISILLQKDPQMRRVDAQGLIQLYAEATGQVTRYETDLIRESFLQSADFIGREAEFGQLTEALNQITTTDSLPTGSAWLIGGESGVGKSRLLEEIRTHAMVSGALVLRGQGIAEGGAPYQLWRDATRHLCLHTQLSQLEASVLKVLVPDIHQFVGHDVPDAPELAPQDAQNRLISTLIEVFRRQSEPIVLLLEDLQWAVESLLILNPLTQTLLDTPLVIICTYRSEERPDLPEEIPEATVIQLERLNYDEVAALTSSMLGDSAGEHQRVVDFLANETEGNAFFIVEVVRALAERAGQLNQISKITLPQHVLSGGMQTVIAQRLEHVPQWSQELLEISAVVGRDIDLAVLHAALPDANLDRWLQVCDDARILEVQDGIWRFTHHKIRETLLERISPETKQHHNQRVALALEAVYPDDGTYLALLAHHWGEAQNKEREAKYSELAAELSLTNGASTEAVRFLERAAQLRYELKAPKIQLAHIEQRLGAAYLTLGKLDDSAAHSTAALEILGRTTPQSGTRVIISILLQLLGQLWNRLTARFTHMQTRQAKNAEVLLTAGRACEQMVQVLYFKNQRFATFYMVLQAMNLMEAAGIEGLADQARGYASMALGMGTLGQKRLADMYARLADNAAARTLDMDTRSWVLATVAFYRSSEGDWENAIHRLEMAASIAQHLGHTRRWEEASSVKASAYFLQAQWDQAATIYEEIYETAVRIRDRQSQGWALSAQGTQAVRLGQYENALENLQRSIPLYEESNDTGSLMRVFGVMVQLYTRWDKLAEAQPYVERIETHINASPAVRIALTDSYIGVAEYHLSLMERSPSDDTRQAAEAAVQRLNRFARTFTSGRPIAQAYHAWMLALTDNVEDAVKKAQDAVETARNLNMPFEEALAYYHTGRLLPQDHPQRQSFLDSASTIFERLGVQQNQTVNQNP